MASYISEPYRPTEEGEIGRGEVMSPDGGLVRIVIRTYDQAEYGDEKPIKFVPMHDIESDEDVAIYVPSSLLYTVDSTVLNDTFRVLIYHVGRAMHDHGPDAVMQL